MQAALKTDDRSHQTATCFDGYLITLEKLRLHSPYFWERGEGCREWFKGMPAQGQSRQEKLDYAWIRRRLKDHHSHFPTQIFFCQRQGKYGFMRQTLFDLYTRDARPLPEQGGELHCGIHCNTLNRALMDRWSEDLEKRLRENAYTHVFVACTGWNTQAWESMVNYSDWQDACTEAMGQAPFKPLFIGLTWVSDLDIGILEPTSVINKGHDADEIGVTWANVIVNYLLPKALSVLEKKPVYIVMGHSFGARLLTRALNSSRYLADGLRRGIPQLPKADLMISLEGAFSVCRYIEGESLRDGGPYEAHYHERCSRYLLVGSKHDMAIQRAPRSLWEKVAGDGFEYGVYAGDPRAFEKFQAANERRRASGGAALASFAKFVAQLSADGEVSCRPEPATSMAEINFYDCSAIIRHRLPMTRGGAHSDVYSQELAHAILPFLTGQGS